jgi:hypothetical protein
LNQLERRAFLYHECGRKVRRLLNQIKPISSTEELAVFSIEYDEILDQYENHNPLDYYLFVFQNKHKFDEKQKARLAPWYVLYLWLPVARFFPQIMIYLITIVVPFWIILIISTFRLK